MTLIQAPLLTDGATHPAEVFRMMIKNLAQGSQGVAQGDDMKVTALSTPGTSVQISDGAATILGQANAFQGSYTAYNLGSDTVAIAPTGSTPRYDMIVLRVLDPEYEGSLNPASDQICYWDIASNVASTATQPPAGWTAIPLARIAIPASTSVITSAMITDLRQVANPRRTRSMVTYSPSSLVTVTNTQSSAVAFPGGPTWSIAVPDWATQAIISERITGMRISDTGAYGPIAGKLGSSLSLQGTLLDDNISGIHRVPMEVADTLTIPAAYRGTTQTLSMTVQLTSNPGHVTLGSDSATTFVGDIEFVEAPR